MFEPRKIRIALAAGSFLVLTACGSAPPIPSDKLASVETAIASAKDKAADTHATIDLLKAEKKLNEAKKLIEQEEMEQASRLLERALADAKVAESKADAARANLQKENMQDAVETLKKEAERK